MKHPFALALAAGIVASCHAGCARSPATPTPAGQLTAVTVAAGAASLINYANTSQFSATARFVDGTSQDVTNEASWESSNPDVATVSSTGLVTVRYAGDVIVRATYLGKSGAQSVSVPRAVPVAMAIDPATAVVRLGDRQVFTISVEIGRGVPTLQVPPRWMSTNPSVLNMDGSGVATAMSVGEATIEVLFAGAKATRQMRVQSP
jgi:uncharacterized protein YjdB